MLTVDISLSLDGFVAGPDPSLEEPLGRGGERLHEWALSTEAFRSRHGGSGGAVNVDSDMIDETVRRAGATIMGRRMFSGGAGSWEDDPRANGWWGEEPPFHHPVFVLTHHAREPLVLGETTFTFVTEGIEAALERARAAAGGKDVVVMGGADLLRQYLNAGVVDELMITVSPVLLGAGKPLFDGSQRTDLTFERFAVVESPHATHLRFRVRV
jgi:dihydrofolate reductase